MKSIFVSFDEIGWYCLKEILKLGGNVTGVFTLDDDRRERMSGNQAFDDITREYNIPLYKIKNINDNEVLEYVRRCEPDISFVIGWSQLVKNEFISIAKYTCVGMHPTLLPKHRGRAPIPWAIIYGLRKTGVTMFHIKEEADNGEIIGQVEIPIVFEDDAKSLYEKTLYGHIDLVKEYFPMLQEGNAPRIMQDESKASNWPKRTPKDGIVDWNMSARHLYDWVRALTDPYPGAYTFYNERKLIIWKSKLINESDLNNNSGKIVDINKEGLIVSSGAGLIALRSVQFENEVRLTGENIIESGHFKRERILG